MPNSRNRTNGRLYQFGNYPPGRLPFGFHPNSPVGRNRPPPVQQPRSIPNPYFGGKGPVVINNNSPRPPAPNNGGGGGRNGGGSSSRGGGSSKFLSMSDFLGNQPFSVAATYGKSMKSKMARLQADANSCIIAHRELLVPNLAGSTAFTVQTFQALNPGLTGLSSWLAAIASDYEEYEFLDFTVEYITRSPSNTKGSVGICYDYDPGDPPPASEIEASQMVGTVEGNVWRDMAVSANVVNMKGATRKKFVRSGATLGDIRNFDSGTFSVYTNDCVDTSSIGKVWISYRVKLSTPQSPIQPAVSPSTCSQFSKTVTQTFTSGIAASLAIPEELFNPLTIAVSGDGLSFTPTRGAYKVSVCATFFDSVSENFSATIQMRKDNVPVGSSLSANLAGATALQVPMSMENLVSCNGTEVITFLVTLSGAAGTLQAIAGYVTAIFSIC